MQVKLRLHSEYVEESNEIEEASGNAAKTVFVPTRIVFFIP